MNNRTRIWPRICSAFIMAVAAGLVWALACIWSGYMVSLFTGSSDYVYETIVVAGDGTPLIQTYSSTQPGDPTFRTLNGKPYESDVRSQLTPGIIGNPPRPPGLMEQTLSWQQRVAGVSDNQRRPTSWYLIRNEAQLGQAYLVGYDEQSRLCIGYIGRTGFRRSMPPQEEWFDVGRRIQSWSSGIFASTGYVQSGGRANSQNYAEQRFPSWRIFLIDGQRLLEIDLRERSIRTMLESPDLLDVAVASEAVSKADADPPQEPSNQPQYRVIARLTDRILVFDPPTSDKKEFSLPESLRDRALTTYLLGPDELLLEYWLEEGQPYGPTQLAWLKQDGKFDREQTITLAHPDTGSERLATWMAAGMAPVPIGWLGVTTLLAPLSMLQVNQTKTYAEGLAKVFEFAGPAFMGVIVLGIVLAWITYRLQRKYRRPGTSAWATFVLLLGVPGLIAYWLENRRTKLESCDACGEVVPRDRDVCAACNAQFPTPPLVGTEIFA